MRINIKKINKKLILFIAVSSASVCGCTASDIKQKSASVAETDPGYFEVSSPNQLSPEFKRSGMISSSTYQVYMQIYAESESEVEVNGLKSARDRAFHLIRKEPFIHSRITENGLKNLKKIIAENGRIVKYVQDGPRTYSIVFQISKIGLRNEFMELF